LPQKVNRAGLVFIFSSKSCLDEVFAPHAPIRSLPLGTGEGITVVPTYLRPAKLSQTRVGTVDFWLTWSPGFDIIWMTRNLDEGLQIFWPGGRVCRCKTDIARTKEEPEQRTKRLFGTVPVASRWCPA